MAICDDAHRAWDGVANQGIQIGTLPGWTRVQGKVVWWVVKGPLADLGTAWRTFHSRVGAERLGRPDGPPGEVFACRPEDHAADGQRNLLTILYVPVA